MKKILIIAIIAPLLSFSQTVIGTDKTHVVLDETGLIVTDGAVSKHYTAFNEDATNFITFGLVSNYQVPTGIVATFSQPYSGWNFDTANIVPANPSPTPTSVITWAQGYLPTVVRPGSQIRVMVCHNTVQQFRGRLVIKYAADTVYAQNIVWKDMDIDQASTGITSWMFPIYDTGWEPLNGPYIAGAGTVHDISPFIRVRMGLGIDKSEITTNGGLVMRVLVRMPANSGGGKYDW